MTLRERREGKMMTDKEAHIEYDMLKGNINRMFLTDDTTELNDMYKFSKKRIEMIFEYNCDRILRQGRGQV